MLCRKCPRDLFHHQAYHFVNHKLCKFCRNEKHKYDGIVSLKDCQSNMIYKHNNEKLSCHICNQRFHSIEKKKLHIITQHENYMCKSLKCIECNRIFQSKQALSYYQKITHQQLQEEYSCSICMKKFTTMHGLDVLTRSVHQQQKFFCKRCFAKFTGHSNLVRHYKLVRTKCVRKHVVHARADVVATKLGIILLSSSFFLSFFPSTYFSPRRGLPRKLKFGG